MENTIRFDVITLFPELFAPFMQVGVTRRAFETDALGRKLLDVQFTNPRDYADGNYRRIDDRPFGGGPGMVMLAEPLARCVEAIRAERADLNPVPVILFSPTGLPIDHAQAARWTASGGQIPTGAILVCGRYEGIDQRFIDTYVTEQLSLGDFVLSGGEIAAIALLDAVARLQPGVLGDADSHAQDSFNPALDGLLDCPHYTRPEVWREQTIPAVLLSGNHAHIQAWRDVARRSMTAQCRPDLLAQQQTPGAVPKKL